MIALPTLLRVAGLTATLVACLAMAQAQSPFASVARVNDSVVTQWELDQRELLLKALQVPGDLREEALEQLIDERLQVAAAEQIGIEVTEEETVEAVAEFAGRTNLDVDRFLELIGQAGVEEQSFRDFVRSGVAWRNAVRARFGAQVRVDPSELAKARATVAPTAELQVLLSEIIIPAQTPEAQERARELANELSQITSIDAFSQAAREYSAAASRDIGGRLDWMPLDQLPPQIAGPLLTLRPGEVTDPVPVPNAIALFQLRARAETAGSPGAMTVDYAEFLIPGGRSGAALDEARRLERRVDTCDDLYGEAQGLPANRLIREERAAAEVPQDVALQLARLDPGEVSTELTRGNALVFLMLCSREPVVDEPPSDSVLANRIRNQQLTALAESWLTELRADARIVREE